MRCGFALIKAGDRRADQGAQTPSVFASDRSGDQGVQTPSMPVPHSTPSQPTASTTVSSPQRLQADLFALQREFKEEKELNVKRHADFLALLTALQPKPPTP